MVKYVSKGINAPARAQSSAFTERDYSIHRQVLREVNTEEQEELEEFLEELSNDLDAEETRNSRNPKEILSKKLKDDEVSMLKSSERFLLEAQNIFNVEIIKHILEFHDPRGYVFFNALEDLNSVFARGKGGIKSYHKEWELAKAGGLLEMMEEVTDSGRSRRSSISDHHWMFSEYEVEDIPAYVYTEKAETSSNRFRSLRHRANRDFSLSPCLILVGNFLIQPPFNRTESESFYASRAMGSMVAK